MSASEAGTLQNGAIATGLPTVIGYAMAPVALIAIVGHEGFGDIFAVLNLVLLSFGTPVMVVVCLGLALWVRKRSSAVRTDAAKIAWIIGMTVLLWLDAGTLLLAFAVEGGSIWRYHILAAAVVIPCFLAFHPGRAHTSKMMLGALALASWAMLLPWIRWNVGKCIALDAWRIRGQTLDVVQQVMANYDVDVRCEDGRELDGAVRELDLARLRPDVLVFYPGLGGCAVDLTDGVVTGVGFCYD